VSTAVSGGTDLKGAARNGMLALLGSAIAAVAGLALNVVIGRGLGASASGIFFVVVAVLTVVSTITKLGADTGLVWAISRARALGREGDVRQFVTTAIWPAVVAGTLCGAVIFALAEPLAGLLTGSGGDPQVVARTAEQTEHLLRLAAPFLIVAAPCFVLAAGVRGTGDIVGYTGVQNILVPGLRPLLAGAGIAAGLGLSAAVLTWNVTFVLGTAVAAWLVVRRTRELELAHPGAERRPKAEISREFWGFSAPRAVSAALEVALTWTDVLIVAALTSPRDAGIYAAASRFITTGTLAEGAMRVAMAPEVNRLLSLGDLDGASRLCAIITQWMVVLAWPLYLLLALYSQAIMSVFGAEFTDGATALTVLAIAMLAVMAAGNNQTILLMSGRSGVQLANRVFLLVLNVLLNLWLVPDWGGWGLGWGMNGAALAWALTWIADAVIVLTEVRYVVGLRRSWARVVPAMVISVLAFVPIGLAVVLWLDSGTVASIGGGLVSVLLFGGLLLLNRSRLDVGPLRQALRR